MSGDLHPLRYYEVERRAVVSHKVRIQAANQHEAAALVRARYEGVVEAITPPARMSVQEVRLVGVDEDGAPTVEDEWEVYAWCEACQAPLFCDDVVHTDGEVDLCDPCVQRAAGAVEAAREEGSQ